MFGTKKSKNQIASEYNQKSISYKNILSTLIILVLFVGIFYMGHYATSQISNLNKMNLSVEDENSKLLEEVEVLKTSNTSLIQEKSELLAEIEAIRKRQKTIELEQIGINLELVEIKKQDIAGEWRVSTFSYNLVTTYLTDDVSDLGELRDDPEFQDMSFLMLEIDVSDIRTAGEERNVPINDYLEIVDGNISANLFTEEYLTLKPGESDKLYAGFIVEPDSLQFELRFGYSSNLDIRQIDFESQNAQRLKGVFMLTKGFAEKYIE
jgi:hypothetical protein